MMQDLLFYVKIYMDILHKGGAAHLATWLTCLRIAQKIKMRVDGIELPYLMLGFIAPFLDKDQEGDLEFEDMLKCSKVLTSGRSVILEDQIRTFEKRYIEPPFIIYKSDSKRSLLWGYYFNLIVSRLWINSFPKGDDIRSYLNANDIYDYDFLSKNGYDLIEQFEKCQITISKCDDFEILKLIQLKDKIAKYYKNNRSIINSENIKNFNPETVEQFILKAEKLCISNLLEKP